jgi:hypothetical protein
MPCRTDGARFRRYAGIGLLLDVGGNDSYFAGGKYPCDWLPGHNFSLSQGFGYGMRPFTGGGVGILCDVKGDDHYVADVYGQGASYWYSVGMLLDADGNDTYEAHQYCQGAGIHLSSGALIDWAGNDKYTAGHICQGAAHDYSVGMLIDRAGNDKYTGDTTAKVRRSTIRSRCYSIKLATIRIRHRPKQSKPPGHDGDKREYGSIALMLDLAGKDTYSQGQLNNAVWLKPLYGAGLDAEITGQAASLPLPVTTAGELPALQSGKRLFAIAPVDPHHPTEHLLRVAISDQPDAGKAWDELKHQGTNALPYLLTRLDSPNVLVRAKTEELIDHLGTNSIPALIAASTMQQMTRLPQLLFPRAFQRSATPSARNAAVEPRPPPRPVAFYTSKPPARPNVRTSHEGSARTSANDPACAPHKRSDTSATNATAKLIRGARRRNHDVRYAAEDARWSRSGNQASAQLRNAHAKASSCAATSSEALARLKDSRALKLGEEEYRHDDQVVHDAIMQSLRAALAGAKSTAPPPIR